MTLRNDATRLRIETRDDRRPRAVVARQGQVLLDTDLDQESRHVLDRIEQETTDTLGSPGRLLVPAGSPAFLVTPNGGSVDIGAGHGYLDGWLLENPGTCRIGPAGGGAAPYQPHPRSETVAAPVILGIKAVVRYVDPVEEPRLADVALGDAQASGRSLADWQVFPLVPTPGGPGLTCASAEIDPKWSELVAPSTGTLRVWAETAAPSTDPCSLTPGGGYTRLENLLYRIEVMGGQKDLDLVDGPRYQLDGLQLRLSRRNASVLARITTVAGAEITVGPPALDTRNWFAPGMYAEIVSPHDDLDATAAAPTAAATRMFRVSKATDTVVTLHEAIAGSIAGIGITTGDDDDPWFLRLWDAATDASSLKVNVPAGATESDEIDLGDGLRARLGTDAGAASARFRLGDYWTFAARVDGSVDWPTVAPGAPVPETPHGPETRYAPIGILNAGATTVDDCRVPFGTLSDQLLVYRGGDGQSVFPPAGATLVDVPAPLRVAVLLGETPIPGAMVRWRYLDGGTSCTIDGQPTDGTTHVDRPTGPDGVSQVPWAIDTNDLAKPHRVTASLLDGGLVTSQPPIVFSATYDLAGQVRYDPPADACPEFAGIDDVAAALDILVKHPCAPHGGGKGSGCCHTVGRTPEGDGEFPTIPEAIKELRRRGHSSICLCLLPGEHRLGEGELEEVLRQAGEELAPVLELELSGLGATLALSARVVIEGLDRVAMRGFRVTTPTSEAFAFVGEKQPLDVDLDDMEISVLGREAGGALVTFHACQRVRVQDCSLLAREARAGLRKILPSGYATVVELVRTSAEGSQLRERLGELTALPENRRRSLVRAAERAISENREDLDEGEIALLDASLEPLRAGALPTPARMHKVVADWRRLVDLFRPQARSWPVAIAFSRLVPEGRFGDETDAVIEGCRIRGGVVFGNGERDTEAEEGADEGIMFGEVPDGFGRVRLDGNVLGWLGLGSELSRELASGGSVADVLAGWVPVETLITRNTFTAAPSLHVAAAATVHGNVFEDAALVQGQQRIGMTVSRVASAAGNLGPDGFDHAATLVLGGRNAATSQAANSRMTVLP